MQPDVTIVIFFVLSKLKQNNINLVYLDRTLRIQAFAFWFEMLKKRHSAAAADSKEHIVHQERLNTIYGIAEGSLAHEDMKRDATQNLNM